MADNPALLVALIVPVSFVAMWLLVTSLLGLLSGWHRLRQAFPDTDEPALLRLGFQSGWLGSVRMGNALTLSATRSGLRVGIARFLGPFQRPFLVPWSAIAAEKEAALFGSLTRLRLGRPETATLTLRTSSWERLAVVRREGGV